MTKLEFMYFEDCPSYQQTLKNVKEVLSELDIHVDLKLVSVESRELANKLGFYGSPTIKIDGVDLEERKGDFSYNCRLYKINDKLTGTLTKNFIREKLDRLILQNRA